MNNPPTQTPLSILVALLGALAFLAGCATTQTHSTASTSSAVGEEPAYRKDKHLQKVWLADGFNFTGYDTLYVAPTRFAAVERANEAAMRATATRLIAGVNLLL